MRVVIPNHHSRAIQRIGDALARHVPAGVEVARFDGIRKDQKRGREIEGERDGDVVVLFVNGIIDHQTALAQRCLDRGQKYAVVQIALRTTRQPLPSQWFDIWRRAQTVWSYYPLLKWMEEERSHLAFDFYHAPLGVDSQVFTAEPAVARDVLVCTSGARRSQESVAECDDAAVALGGTVFQLGNEFNMRARTHYAVGITDAEVAAWYRRCRWVSGLRRHEGFELPAAEGLLCGARPVLYDKPHYRCWYDGLADFVREGQANDVTRDLVALFQTGGRLVTAAERERAKNLFNWETICRGFWERVL